MSVVAMPSGRDAVPAARAVEPIFTVDGIVKQFETPDGVLTAVDNVSLAVKPGEFFLGDRPVRLRQVDTVQHHRRPARRL